MTTQDRKSTVLERAITKIKSWNSEDEVPWLTHRAAIEILTAAVQEAVREEREKNGIPANEVLRSVYQVIVREGKEVNWYALARTVFDELEREHSYLSEIYGRMAVLIQKASDEGIDVKV